MTASGTAAPLAGIVVLDLSRVLAGPLCAQRLADLGARVLKLEPPGGDATRAFGPPFVAGESPYFIAFNRGKESLELDLKSPLGREVLARALGRADVLIENFRPGVLDRLGFPAARIAKLAPRIVHLTISGWGSDSDRAGDPAFDLTVQAESGLMAMNGSEDGGPCRVPFSAADTAAAHAASEAVLAALVASARGTAVPRRIEVSLIDATLAMTGFQAQATLLGAGDPARMGHRHPNLVPYQLFATADGELVLAVATDAQWARLVRCDSRLEPLDRAEWARNAGRVGQREELCALLARVFSTDASDAWRRRLHAADVPFGTVRGLGAALADATARPRGPVIEVDHERLGATSAVSGGAVFDGVRARAERAAPVLDQHGEALLAELAVDEAERERWLAAHRDGPRC